MTVQANSVGTATLSALAGTQSGTAQITVLPAGASLPIGTVQWEIPSLGFKISKSVQALRVDDTTPDLYFEDDGPGAIRAFTADGLQKWIWPSGPSDKFPLLAAADDQGGAIYFASQDTPNQFDSFCYFRRVDENGNESWQYQETNCSEDYAIGPDGTIYLLEDNFQNTNNVLTALDPTTGAIKFTVPLPGFDQSAGQNFTMMPVPGQSGTNIPYCTPGATVPSTTSNNNNAQAFEHGTMSISSDGTLYIPLSGITTVLDGLPCDSSPDPNNPGYTHPVNTSAASWMATANLYLMTVQPNGTYSIQTVDSRTNQGTNWNAATATQFNPFMQRPIPDSQGGVFLPLEQAVYHLSSSGNAKISLPITVSSKDLLVGEDGTAYVSGASSASSGADDALLAIDPVGNIKWTASPGGAPTATQVLADGSVAFQNVLLDFSSHEVLASSSGQITPLFANPDGSDAGPVGSFSRFLPTYAALGSWYSPASAGGLDSIMGSMAYVMGSAYPQDGGDRQHQRAPRKGIKVQVFKVTESNISDFYVQDKVNTGLAHWLLQGGVQLDWDGKTQSVPGCDQSASSPGCTSGGSTDLTNITLTTQLAEVQRRFPATTTGVQLLFTNQLGPNNTADGYTPPENKNANGISNVALFKKNSDVQLLVAHELGHVLGLSHTSSFTNLMCGPTGDALWDLLGFCWGSITSNLSSDQINTAQKTAAKLVGP